MLRRIGVMKKLSKAERCTVIRNGMVLLESFEKTGVRDDFSFVSAMIDCFG